MSVQSNQSPQVNREDTEMLPDPAELSTMNYSQHTHNTAPTRFAQVGGSRFAYRRFGNPVGTPIVLLQHFMGNLDNYDPAITDALAPRREVILTDNAGVGLSAGEAPKTVSGMARDAASLIDALGLEHADLFGFSMGGFVAQQIAVDRPELVRRLILVGTGPRGGEGWGSSPLTPHRCSRRSATRRI
jgi:pimeloyl-ACP methyl ester carboxylesterase